MNNLEVIKILAARSGRTQKETREMLRNSILEIRNVLDQGLGISLPRLGTFETRLRGERKSFNPHYKKRVILPPKRVVVFHSSAALKRHTSRAGIDHEG